MPRKWSADCCLHTWCADLEKQLVLSNSVCSDSSNDESINYLKTRELAVSPLGPPGPGVVAPPPKPASLLVGAACEYAPPGPFTWPVKLPPLSPLSPGGPP